MKTRARLSFALAVLAVAGLALGACGTRGTVRGNPPDEALLAQIQPGVQTKAQVASLLGTPSSTGTFDDNTWFYIGQHEVRDLWYPAEATKRDVVKIKFDDSGRVASIETRDLDDGVEVALVERKTPTRGQQLTFLQQMWLALIGGPVGNTLGGEVDVYGANRE